MTKNSVKQNVDQLREWMKVMKIKTQPKRKTRSVRRLDY